jgi:hypothetical protein
MSKVRRAVEQGMQRQTTVSRNRRCARKQKKPGPYGPGLKFASVGAPANHLPEGKKLRACGNQSGRITAPHVTQEKLSMQTDAAAHNAAADMPAMHYR